MIRLNLLLNQVYSNGVRLKTSLSITRKMLMVIPFHMKVPVLHLFSVRTFCAHCRGLSKTPRFSFSTQRTPETEHARAPPTGGPHGRAAGWPARHPTRGPWCTRAPRSSSLRPRGARWPRTHLRPRCASSGSGAAAPTPSQRPTTRRRDSHPRRTGSHFGSRWRGRKWMSRSR